MSIRIRPIQHS